MIGKHTRTVLNAFGSPIVDDGGDPDDSYWVPEGQRFDTDVEDPESNALGPDGDGVDTGDDLDGWKPGDEPT